MFANLLYILSAEEIAHQIDSQGNGHYRAAVNEFKTDWLNQYLMAFGNFNVTDQYAPQ